MLVSLTVGKVDAGVAVLLTQDKRLIEFPSILLPPSITSGSIVDITVSQNHVAEQKAAASFDRLQSEILDTYGLNSPATPVLRLRNVTQTSIVLEWDPIDLQTTTLRSLSLYRNGQKAGNIPRPFDMHSTKISGLQLETEYTFHLVLRTSGGTYTSNVLQVKTHSMTNLTGITVTPGILPPQLRTSLEAAVKRIGAKISETLRIDTTHFVCTEGRGRDWERANEMNIPIVRPEWIEGCEREGKLIGVRAYYLDANPKHRQIGSNPKLEGATASGSNQPQNLPMTSPDSQAAAVAANLTTPSQKTNGKDDNEEEQEESELEGEPGPEIAGTPIISRHPRAESNDHEDEDEDEDSENSKDEPAADSEKHNLDHHREAQVGAHHKGNGGGEGEDEDEEEEEDEDKDKDEKEGRRHEKHDQHAQDEEEDEDEEEEPSSSKGKATAETGGELEDVAL